MRLDAVTLHPRTSEETLWIEVLSQAIRDLKMRVRNAKPPVDQGSAKRWFANDRHTVGSFVWVCSVLDISPAQVRNQLRVYLR